MRAADLSSPARPRPVWPRLALAATMGAGALALGQLAAFAKGHALLVNASPSLPHWAIWLERGPVPRRGEIVLFDPPRSKLLEAHFGKDPAPFGKRVTGMPGDLVTRQGDRFFVNGRLAAVAKPRTRRGEPLALGPTGRIPAGCYFLATDHPDGFDSRYAAIGWICRDRLIGIGRPIL